MENLLPFAFPASVIGMLLLFVLLIFGILKVEHIREKSDFLLSNMAFFFIPAGVSIINYFDVLAGNVGKLLLICLFTTILTFAVTAWTIRSVLWLMNRRQADSGRIEADITGKAGTEENRTAERKIKEGRKEYV